MRTLLFLTVFLYSFSSFAQKKAAPFIKDRPMPAHAVNDFGKFLKKDEKDQLEKQINAYHKTTGNIIVIVTVPTLTDTKTNRVYSIEEVSSLYFDKWHIGDSVKYDRVLVICEPENIRIVSRGQLTAADRNHILEQMAPAYNAGEYFTLFKTCITALESTIDSATQAKKTAEIASLNNSQPSQPAFSPYQPKQKEMTPGETIVGFLGLSAIVFYFVYRKRRRGVLANSIDEGFASDADAWLTRAGTTHRRTVND